MPVTILVHCDDSSNVLANSTLTPLIFDAPRILIGRGSSCDVRLPDVSVSSRHASIRVRENQYVVVDEGSSNGTRLNGEKLSPQAPRALRSGDSLQLGRIRLTVRLGAAPPSNPDATREVALALVARILQRDQLPSMYITVLQGPELSQTLTLVVGSTYSIGRDPRCSLRLTDRNVPPVAVELTLEHGRVKLSRYDERGEMFLEERKLVVREPTFWAHDSILRIGNTTLRLEDPIARALEQSALGDDEKVNVSAANHESSVAELNSNAVAEESSTTNEKEPANEQEISASHTSVRTHDRRRSWRGMTLAFEIVALILGLVVLIASIIGMYMLLRK